MTQSGDGAAGPRSHNVFLRGLATLDRWLGNIERLIVGGGILVMAIVMSGHVLGRLIFGEGIPGTSEITELLIILITFIGVSYAARSARHISMSALYDQLGGTARKGLLVLICLGTAALMFYLAFESADYTLAIYERGRTSSALTIPLWIVYLAAPIGFTLAGVQYVLTAVRNLTSHELYRSFTEKEEYAEVPVEEEGAAAGTTTNQNNGA
ncbi:Ectoine/5-hydroxyectoine TRAP transporter small permease protein UehB [wastewater metagenome]|uniref:Ectoine/5-hydroxyectoine TRAP transporter small permease protein UehB n=2 Tax=unclassified sequences TaxID=12908 RepID=A0A5B8R8L0_9ZZZZ|nr:MULTISPECIES: TRAP transporter small permease [Arhodomonas]MCS4504572.1 TRAP transporter small permease [Arhodomonas aquaeolei]QEA05469.1 ectoine/5-hydroxyectoine TRAP transporter small permease protein UehB [uncultured organism]